MKAANPNFAADVRGRVMRPGRTLIVARAGIFAGKAGKETLSGLMRQTIMVMHGKA